jgi:hypothetical protein
MPIISGTAKIGGAAATEKWWTWLNETYTVVGAYDFRSAISLAAATKIGSTPTVDTEPAGGAVLGANGLECDEDTALDTGIIVSNTDNYSMYAVFSGATTTGLLAAIAGAYDNNKRFTIGPHWSDSGMFASVGYSLTAGNYDSFSPTMTSGGYGIADETPYRNGTADGSKLTGTTAGLTPYPIFIGARNLAGTANRFFAGNIGAVVVTSDTISDAHMAELHTRMVA